MQTVGDKTLISGLRSYAWPVRATNYGRWCRWWLQSNRLSRNAVTNLVALIWTFTNALISCFDKDSMSQVHVSCWIKNLLLTYLPGGETSKGRTKRPYMGWWTFPAAPTLNDVLHNSKRYLQKWMNDCIHLILKHKTTYKLNIFTLPPWTTTTTTN